MYKEVRTVVYDEELRIGIIANTAAVMGLTLGKAMPEVVCADRRRASRRCVRSSTNRIFRR